MKKRDLIVSIFIIAILMLSLTVTSNAYAMSTPSFSDNNPVISEKTNFSKGTTEITVEKYGNTNAKKFYFYTTSSNPTQTYDGKTRNFKYNFELNGSYSAKSGRLIDAKSCVDFDGNITGYNFNTVEDKYIAHDENGVFYLLNRIYEEQISASMVAGSPADIDTVFTYDYELIPIAKNVSIKISDVSFSNLDEINQRGNFVLDANNTYSPIYADAKKDIEKAVNINGYREGVIPFTSIEDQLYLFTLAQTSSGEYIYKFKLGASKATVANGVTTYTMPATLKYDESYLEIYQDGDKSATQTYQLTLPSKSSGKLKVYYLNPEERNTSNATSKVVNVSNGNFSIDIPTGKKARFYVCSGESKVGSINVKLPVVNNADTYWGYNETVVGEQMVNTLYEQYILGGKNDFHGLLLAHIEKQNLEKNKYEAHIANSEWGNVATLFVYNKEKPEVIPTYTITWKNWDGTVLQTKTVNKGTTPVYSGATPVKSADSSYTYTFSGWTPSVTAANANTTYTATFKATAKPSTQYYTITWKNWNGTILKTQTVAKGTIPSYGSNPTRPADSSYTYTFSGWTPTVKAASANATYTAQYTAKKKVVQPALNVKVKISAPKAAKTSVTAKWKKLSKSQQKKVSKIEVQISTSKKFTKTTTYRVSKSSASKKISKLKRKTTYYVRVRAIKGSKFGPWSSIKTIKTK